MHIVSRDTELLLERVDGETFSYNNQKLQPYKILRKGLLCTNYPACSVGDIIYPVHVTPTGDKYPTSMSEIKAVK